MRNETDDGHVIGAFGFGRPRGSARGTVSTPISMRHQWLAAGIEAYTREASCEPKVERGDEKAKPQQRPSDNFNNGIIVATSQRRVGMGHYRSVLLPGRGFGRRGEGERVVNATIERETIVETWQREGQSGLW